MKLEKISSQSVARIRRAFPRVCLVGPMGSGKTSIGKILAQHLDYAFVDTDHEIVKRSGADIPWIFDIEGEAGFRRREQQVIQDVCSQPELVIATGGGCILNEMNRQLLRESTSVVHLKVQIDAQLKRTYRDRNRPLLQCDDPRGVLERLQEVRSPLYEAVAHTYLDTSHGNVREISFKILTQLEAMLDAS